MLQYIKSSVVTVLRFDGGPMKISISQQNDNVNFKPVEINSLQDLVKQATKYNYSTGIFKNNYRKKDNFIQADFIAIDVDNDDPNDTYTIEGAKEIFKDYKHIIMPTKSHRKDKNGRIADRFRVILFLETSITDAKNFTATWGQLLKYYPAADKACKDAARFYYPSPEVFSVMIKGKTWPVTDYVPWFYVLDGLHSGVLIHSQWKWVNDFIAVIAIFLVITGLIRWWRKKWI